MIITLLSDLGYKDSMLGVVKGIFLKAIPELTIMDISHDVVPFHSLECSYLLKNSYNFFPTKTIHICLFDIPLKKYDYWLFCAIDDYIILCPENGILPLSFENQLDKVYRLPLKASSFLDCVQQLSFYLSEWYSEGIKWEDYAITKPKKIFPSLDPYITEDGIEAQVLHINRYGNVVLNIHKNKFYEIVGNRKFSIHFSRHDSLDKIVQFYEDVEGGDPLFRFNDFGFLEFAVNRGSAASLYGLNNLPARQLVYSKIKITIQDDTIS